MAQMGQLGKSASFNGRRAPCAPLA